MSTTTTITPPSPLRVLQRLLFRLRAAGSPPLACDVMGDQLAIDEAVKMAAIAQSREIEASLEKIRRDTSAFLTDPVSPGIIDERESRVLSGEMLDVSLAANTHRRHLQQMV